jgi:ankyrin repeat protein
MGSQRNAMDELPYRQLPRMVILTLFIAYLRGGGADVNTNAAWRDGLTALQAASLGGHLTVVDRLLDCGANANARPASWSGATALQTASGARYVGIVSRLLDTGADPNAD